MYVHILCVHLYWYKYTCFSSSISCLSHIEYISTSKSLCHLTSIGHKSSDGVNDPNLMHLKSPSDIYDIFDSHETYANRYHDFISMIIDTPYQDVYFSFYQICIVVCFNLGLKESKSMLMLWSCSIWSSWRAYSRVKNLLLISSIVFSNLLITSCNDLVGTK